MKNTLKQVALHKFFLPLLAAILFISAAQPYNAIQSAEVQRGGPTWEFDLLNQMGGSMRAVAVQGETAYVGAGPRLVIVDISEPENPQFLGRTEILPDLVENVVVDGDYAYVAAFSAGLFIVDVSDPNAPVVVGKKDGPEEAYGITFASPYIFIAGATGVLQAVDVSNPAQPEQIWSMDEFAMGTDVLVNGDYLYAAMGDLKIYDISEITQPELIATVPFESALGDTLYSIAIGGEMLYVFTQNGNMGIYDISNPELPDKKGAFSVGGGNISFNDIAVKDLYVYLLNEMGLVIFDVIDEENPQLAGYYNISGAESRLVLTDTLALTVNLDNLQIIQISDPKKPTKIGVFETVGWLGGTSLIGDYIYLYGISDSFLIADISNSVQPVPGTRYEEDCWNKIFPVTSEVGYALCEYKNSLALDISDPAKPTTIDEIPIRGTYKFLDQKNLYVLNTSLKKLSIFDLTDLLNPLQIGSLTLSGNPNGLILIEDHLFILIDKEIKVIDVSDPAHPTLDTSLAFENKLISIAASGMYLITSQSKNGLTGDLGLVIVDVSNPTHPQKVGELDTPEEVNCIVAKDSFVYVADNSSVLMVSLQDPSHPQIVASYPIPAGEELFSSRTNGLRLVDDLIYVSANGGGLYILKSDYHWDTYLPLMSK
ncbi:MAG: hypothetical protein CVU39_00520 [Chloroflexi bacterium HGW-Chloroflexi-10]|nr:MAG: hypothetical protein CVU39_00520 [Chloroflexi bacterium HGW-Chloroflexi-10]